MIIVWRVMHNRVFMQVLSLCLHVQHMCCRSNVVFLGGDRLASTSSTSNLLKKTHRKRYYSTAFSANSLTSIAIVRYFTKILAFIQNDVLISIPENHPEKIK